MSWGSEDVPLTAVVPTVGRYELLVACLESLARCDPTPAEVLVVDQSGRPDVAQLVDSFQGSPARLVRCRRRGAGQATNEGLRHSRYDVVAVTHDDCTVAASWAGIAWELTTNDPDALITGRVLPAGDALSIPSTKESLDRAEFTEPADFGMLFPSNMVLNRTLALALGGFDERFTPEHPAEDIEFCYRWLKGGHRVRYEPKLLVWHHDWRTPEQLEQTYVAYWRGQGFFYAKHLRQGDRRMLGFLVRNLGEAARSVASAVVRRRPRWSDPRRGILPGLPRGLLDGWRAFARERAR